MFQVIVVDDEISALNRFQRIASADSRLSVEGTFQYAKDALDYAREHPVDLAFLDIEMPEMNGLELAERLLEIDACIRVIFLTAYHQYALDAFRAHAIGYLLKPLDSDELKEQIGLLSRRYDPRPVIKKEKHLHIRCFGQFSVYPDSDHMSTIRWKTAKAEELFALLVHYQGRPKSKDVLIDALWPELEPEKSANLFRVTCTYLRSALAEKGYVDILLRELDGYRIHTDMLDCDLYKLREFARSADSVSLKELEKFALLYSGEYLEGKAYDWAAITRTQMESEYKIIQTRIADAHFSRGDSKKACAELQKILAHNPYDEETVERLISIHIATGDTLHAANLYQEYEQRLKKELRLSPSGRLKALLPGLLV